MIIYISFQALIFISHIHIDSHMYNFFNSYPKATINNLFSVFFSSRFLRNCLTITDGILSHYSEGFSLSLLRNY